MPKEWGNVLAFLLRKRQREKFPRLSFVIISVQMVTLQVVVAGSSSSSSSSSGSSSNSSSSNNNSSSTSTTIEERHKGDSQWEKLVSVRICGFLCFATTLRGFLRKLVTPKRFEFQSQSKMQTLFDFSLFASPV